MAGQNTTAEAFLRLRPLENTNIGAIVEEHVRYWKKTRDKEKADELARKAKEAEFNRKINKETFEIYNGLQPEENAGFLNDQIVTTFEKNKPYYMALAKASANGNIDARLALADEKRKIQSAVKINKVYSEKIQELEEQKTKGVFNEVLDSDVERFKTSILQGKYKLNPDWTLDVYSPALEDELKSSSSGLFKDGIVKLNSSTLFNNDFLNSSFNKKAEFVKNGKAIANNLLDTEDGNRQINAQTKVDGIKLVKGLFAEDSVEARTWYGTASRQGLVNFNRPFSDLDEVQQNQLADAYYEQVVRPNLEEVTVDNTLDDALKRQRLRNAQLDATKKRQAIRKGSRDEQANRTTISASTDEEGNKLIVSSLNSQNGDTLATEKSQVFNLAGKPITVGVKGKSGTNKTFSDLIKTDSGEIFAIGQRVEKVDVPVLNEDGSIKLDSNDKNALTRVEERVVDIVESDPKILNNIARQIEDDEGNKLENLNDLNNFLDVKTRQLNQSNIKANETREERIQRLRNAINN